MLHCFITIRFLDILDILLVAFLLYQIYLLIKGTVAINIFVGIFLVYLLWLIVKALNMQLLGSILGQFIGVGVIALIIVFQQEIRRFLLLIGTKYFVRNNRLSLEKLFSFDLQDKSDEFITEIVEACKKLSAGKTGALIVISKRSELYSYTQTGDIINATISRRLIESIFSKQSPLHDGALIIVRDKIRAARCVLPVSDSKELGPELGLRHRSAHGMSQSTGAGIVIVSEETGEIAYAKTGKIHLNVSVNDLTTLLREDF
ncbi:MAG: diadenylate cyclase CdaA [Bacteroidetes bacterium]|nr:diadenylate cyclase CdaA [Bacteroidota bacterium]